VTVSPTMEQITAFIRRDRRAPITMVALVKFREQAAYPAGYQVAPCSGIDAYRRYIAGIAPFLEQAGARIVFRGPVEGVLIGCLDEPAADWDEISVLAYPSREAFLEMIRQPEYQLAMMHRVAGLVRMSLLQCPSMAALPQTGCGEALT
jgi:uncharacterized protein (DUF1330 family)